MLESSEKLIYEFANGVDSGIDESTRSLLGNKGEKLFQMSQLGMNVPPGFILSSKLCVVHEALICKPDFLDGLKCAVKRLEERARKSFGGGSSTLVLSVRSSGAVSMPGMMDTILNVGVNRNNLHELTNQFENADETFALDSYRRFLLTYGTLVLEVPADKFSPSASLMSKNELEQTVDAYERVLSDNCSVQVDLEDSYSVLLNSIRAVFKSWQSERAIAYRKVNNISDELGTAVVVQAMVFGNASDNSCSGVAFSRNPLDGTDELYGNYIRCSQGEDVVSGKVNASSLATKTGDSSFFTRTDARGI